jgi:hypothetical protein
LKGVILPGPYFFILIGVYRRRGAMAQIHGRYKDLDNKMITNKDIRRYMKEKKSKEKRGRNS